MGTVDPHKQRLGLGGTSGSGRRTQARRRTEAIGLGKTAPRAGCPRIERIDRVSVPAGCAGEKSGRPLRTLSSADFEPEAMRQAGWPCQPVPVVSSTRRGRSSLDAAGRCRRRVAARAKT